MLKEKLREDMKTAMKAKEQAKLGVLRMMLSDIQAGETLAQPVDELKSVQKYRKKIADAIQLSSTPELVYELSVVDLYLPRQVTREEIEACVIELVRTTAFTMEDYPGKDKFMFGHLMKLAKEKLPNADGKVLSEVLRAKLK